uniref:Ig-like domain-containing protein n=1 Tax=Podarcis muralis TaxID=64176 RepID=A0A670K7B1_PODMU
MYNTSKCQACYASLLKPTVSIIKPSYRDVVEGTANVTCVVVGFGLENIEVTWDVDGKPSTMGQKTMRGKDASGAQEIKNTHTISLEQWRKGTRFTCKVAGGCYEEVIKQLTIKKETQTMEPSITVSKANFDVSLQSTVALILVCNVNGFSPEEISISWKKDNNILNETLYDNGPVTPAGKGYTTYSILKIGRDEAGGKGGSYSCVVHHSSSNQPLTKSEKVPIDSWDCAIMGAALCDIRNENEDEYSELEEANSVWNKVSTFMVLFTVAIFYGGLVTFIKVK